MKLQVAAHACEHTVSTVTMLYLSTAEVVRQHVRRNTCMEGFITTSPAYIRAWNVLSHVMFVYVHEDVVTAYVPGEESVRSFAVGSDECASYIAATDRRLVTWGGGCLGSARPVSDIACYLQTRLSSDVEMDIRQANVMTAQVFASSGHEETDHLQKLYLGICRSMFFVYFWNGKPHGIYTPSLPQYT
jgi:hypothetical protein